MRRQFDSYHHVRLGDQADLAPLASILSGRAVDFASGGTLVNRSLVVPDQDETAYARVS